MGRRGDHRRLGPWVQREDPVAAGSPFVYEFTAPDPGTYFYHPHVGVQLDRGPYAPLIIDDPAELGDYDHEWVAVLDDWIDGTGTTPDDVLANLTQPSGSSSTNGMEGMDMGDSSMGGMPGMGGTGSSDSPFGDAGDVTYPHFLINGRIATAPELNSSRPTSFKSTCFDSPANNVGPWPASLGCTTNS